MAEVLERLGSAARRSGRNPADVTLVGASKRQPLDRIVAAVRCGVTCLGENDVQEARDKRPAVEALLRESDCPLPRWHMIGHLQRNKVRAALSLFDVVETVDRLQLASEIDRRVSALAGAADSQDPVGAAEAPGLFDLFVQVNTSGEPQKAGVAPDDLPALLEACAPLEHVRVVGLMTLPAAAAGVDTGAVREPFARLRELRDHLQDAPGGHALRELSMGMSGDFELAVEEGATLVRVGTALFGARKERT